jgi:hypothetical protein
MFAVLASANDHGVTGRSVLYGRTNLGERLLAGHPGHK